MIFLASLNSAVHASANNSSSISLIVITQIAQQEKTVRGTIGDNYGTPVIDANIAMKGEVQLVPSLIWMIISR